RSGRALAGCAVSRHVGARTTIIAPFRFVFRGSIPFMKRMLRRLGRWLLEISTDARSAASWPERPEAARASASSHSESSATATGTDVAEQLRQQARELHEIQRRLERASLSTQEGHWELDLLTGKHWASSSYYVLLGYRPDDSHLDTFEKVRALVHPEEHARNEEITFRHVSDGTPYQFDTRLRMPDGSWRWFRLRGLAERDANGKPIRISGSIHDIHEQREAEQ